MENIIYATVVIGVMGLVFGLLLGIASKVFKVEQDEKIPLIMEVLPGANCGGCGFAGCSQFAEAVIKGEAKPNGCTVGGAVTAAGISKIMGIQAEAFEKKFAFVQCAGCDGVANRKFTYDGTMDCVSAARLMGGQKACVYGCLGFGSCMEACKFGAIKIVDGLATVDIEKCTGCGACASACPKSLIKIISKDDKYVVKCQNNEKGAVVRNECSAGCLGCKLCEKNCPVEAVKVENFLSSIDKEKCIGCGTCAEKCPKKIIKKVNV